MDKTEQVTMESDFIKMVQANERIVYKVCSFYVSDCFLMEDLYQETVLNLWKAYPKFRNESSLSTWIYKIALNTCISGMRKESKHRRQVPLSFSNEIVFEPDNEEDNIRELYRLIYQLKTLEKAIVLLYLEEKSYQEIADITGLTLSNVATKLKRIKEKLKSMSNQ
ncbi:MAG: sigma-70 family RNA polymerase sigma factor [Dysgonamonadaceae bacterium]|jgi:RNA polymerase sigma-70 factor (ECF subfamily)|nr:sigma-70 family RNA polymerase sigma factor [Dysgonamonadaceae bacterium]